MTTSIMTRRARAARTPDRGLRNALWGLQILAALIFLLAGSAKLGGAASMITVYEQIGAVQRFHYVTGAVEVVGAIMLLCPGQAMVGSMLLALTMGCAAAAHLDVLGGRPLPALLLLAHILTVS